MIIAPRWRKVLRDIWVNRVRTVLIVLTVAAGVFAIGTIGASALTLQRQVPADYRAISPAHLIFTTSPFDADLAESIATMPGVAEAEARRNLPVRLLRDEASDTWRDLLLFGIADFDDQRVDKILPVSGEWPPPKGTLLMERGSLAYLSLEEGQEITIKTAQGKQRTLMISGAAHDLYHVPAFLEGTVYGYITDDTLSWLGQDVKYNELYVRLSDDVADPAYVRRMKEKITDRLEGEGVLIYMTEQPHPDGYPLDYIVNTVVLLLILLGALILLLGVCLVISTMSALAAQQARQIAVIKAIGGVTPQVLGIYLGMVLILGALSAAIAIPLSSIGARAMVMFVNGMLNFSASFDRFPPEIIALQFCLAIAAPVVAALAPVWQNAQRPPALALSEYGRTRVWSGIHGVDRVTKVFRGLTGPERLALRNPFRNRSRLIFTLIMLSLAGGSFIMVVNLQTSLKETVGTMLDFWQYDFWVALGQPYRADRLAREALLVPGVSEVEAWGFEMTRRVRPDGTESNPVFLFAAPPESEMVEPHIVEGRWLDPGDVDALVVGMGLLDAEPDLEIGRDIVLKVGGEERTFRIVGVIEMIGNQTVGYITYTTLDTFNRLAHRKDRANMLVVRTTALTAAQRQTIGSAVEDAYEDAGIQVVSVLQMDDERLEIDSAFGVLISLLMIMVFLLSLVGGLGLMGAMGLNVWERSREIGVMRALGGSNRSIFRIVVLEGVAIGVMSWAFSLLLAIPLTWLFCNVIGYSFLSMPLEHRCSTAGALLWLGLVVALSTVFSLLPAANATRLTVREVLSYE
jgi:putative ABC transport system permease protein